MCSFFLSCDFGWAKGTQEKELSAPHLCDLGFIHYNGDFYDITNGAITLHLVLAHSFTIMQPLPKCGSWPIGGVQAHVNWVLGSAHTFQLNGSKLEQFQKNWLAEEASCLLWASDLHYWPLQASEWLVETSKTRRGLRQTRSCFWKTKVTFGSLLKTNRSHCVGSQSSSTQKKSPGHHQEHHNLLQRRRWVLASVRLATSTVISTELWSCILIWSKPWCHLLIRMFSSSIIDTLNSFRQLQVPTFAFIN